MFRPTFLEKIKTKDLALVEKYQRASPFPHVVLDNVFTPATLYSAAANFPRPDETWWSYSNPLEQKFAKDDLLDESVSIRRIVECLQSRRFTDFLEWLTGIQGLVVDQTLRGGGYHQILSGGKLDVHKDFNYHPQLRLKRRLNAILYLNPRWKDNWNGHLELWSGDDKSIHRCEEKIAPILGRLVVFSTEGNAYHGHPEPLACPVNVTRKSLAFYYYTSPVDKINPEATHSTIYMKRPQDPDDEQTAQLRAERAKGRLK